MFFYSRGFFSSGQGREGAAKSLEAAWNTDGTTDGVVAQLVEHLLCKQGVVGSSPSGSTKPSLAQGLLAQLVRASP